ncbi:MAG: calcium-binding protein [Solirubrobacterales bacterium]
MLAGTIGVTAALLGAPAALASNATVSGGNTVRVTASGGERNGISVLRSAATDTYTVTDAVSNLTVTASGPCTSVNASTATCPGAGITRISVNSGNGDDAITLDRLTIPVNVSSNLDGSGGSDVINGARGIDEINGGRSRDLVVGHEGADDLRGGRGTDTVFYADRLTSLLVTVGHINGDDGNELDLTGAVRDTVHGDVENVLGGPGGNAIFGDSSSETLVGGSGYDILVGNNGGDVLLGFAGDDDHFGGRGRDLVRGGDGNDSILGGPDRDRLLAGPGDDFIWGKKGRDVMKGKTGIDRINAKDGRRDIKINCGPGPRKRQKAKRDKRLDPKPKRC